MQSLEEFINSTYFKEYMAEMSSVQERAQQSGLRLRESFVDNEKSEHPTYLLGIAVLVFWLLIIALATR